MLDPGLVAGADVSEIFKLFSLQDGVGSWVRIGGHKRLLQSRLLGGRGLPPLTVFGLTAAIANANYRLYQRTPCTALPEAPQPAGGGAYDWPTRGHAHGSTGGPDTGYGDGGLWLQTSIYLSWPQ